MWPNWEVDMFIYSISVSVKTLFLQRMTFRWMFFLKQAIGSWFQKLATWFCFDILENLLIRNYEQILYRIIFWFNHIFKKLYSKVSKFHANQSIFNGVTLQSAQFSSFPYVYTYNIYVTRNIKAKLMYNLSYNKNCY